MAEGFSSWGNDLYTGRRSYNIVGKRARYFWVSCFLLIACVLVLIFQGFNLGIEFRGGSEFTVSDTATVEQQLGVDAVRSVAPEEEPRVSSVGSNAVRVQTSELSNSQVEQVKDKLATAYDVPDAEVNSTFIGPTWGSDVSNKALQGLVGFLLLVAVVMTLYFRAWRMAAGAIIALLHDLVITAGVYAAIGWEVTPATVIGFLTILGYSMYDTVVVFDKVRENTVDVMSQTRSTYSERANLAVNQTLVRSINTSVVALLPVAGILFVGAFLLGAGTLRDIALALFIGMGVGAYSSIYLATPLEVALREHEPKIKAHTAHVLELRERAATDPDAAIAVGGEAARQLKPGRHLGQAAQPRRTKR